MFTYDPRKAILNFDKHGVSFEEAATVFSDPEGLDFEDWKHSQSELRKRRAGISRNRRILIAVYTVRRMKKGDEIIRILSARQASREEREAYAG
jgi:hypothetical protein